MTDRPGRLLLCIGLTLLLAACASKPIEIATDAELSTVTPSDALKAQADGSGAKVLWGGVIVSSSNLKEATQLEILAYPLNGQQRPQKSKSAQGRFLILVDGYLETVDYASGRLVTVLGQLQGSTEGLVGKSTYQYPTVSAEQLHLWEEKDETQRSGFSFGLGISL